MFNQLSLTLHKGQCAWVQSSLLVARVGSRIFLERVAENPRGVASPILTLLSFRLLARFISYIYSTTRECQTQNRRFTLFLPVTFCAASRYIVAAVQQSLVQRRYVGGLIADLLLQDFARHYERPSTFGNDGRSTEEEKQRAKNMRIDHLEEVSFSSFFFVSLIFFRTLMI